MSSKELYDAIHAANIDDLRHGRIDTDPLLLPGAGDPRRGVSLIIPVQGSREHYQELVNRFSQVEPDQYYYPFEDLHITIFDFIQGSAAYQRSNDRNRQFLQISREAASDIQPFRLQQQGVVFSRTAGLIRGYDDNILVDMREKIRKRLQELNLPNDERYASESAHTTFMRFPCQLRNPQALAELIEQQREIDLGSEKITFCQLVEHDWYNTRSRTRIIGRVEFGIIKAADDDAVLSHRCC
jgi:hypothetical protein